MVDKQKPLIEKLREPFAAHQISKLPKESRAQIDARKADRNVSINCTVCGGWHHKHAVHLDYVGHAALTDRLLDTDLAWSWEPLSFTPEGLPLFDKNNGLWIKLTVLGTTRLGYGSADGKQGGDAIKEIIGDALRNAAMRFGAALDLWHKGDLHADEPEAKEEPHQIARVSEEQLARLQNLADDVGADLPRFCSYFKIGSLADIAETDFEAAMNAIEAKRKSSHKKVA